MIYFLRLLSLSPYPMNYLGLGDAAVVPSDLRALGMQRNSGLGEVRVPGPVQIPGYVLREWKWLTDPHPGRAVAQQVKVLHYKHKDRASLSTRADALEAASLFSQSREHRDGIPTAGWLERQINCRALGLNKRSCLSEQGGELRNRWPPHACTHMCVHTTCAPTHMNMHTYMFNKHTHTPHNERIL